jgi:hypothetical protein
VLPVERHCNSARTGTTVTVLSRQGHDGTSVSIRAPNLPKLAFETRTTYHERFFEAIHQPPAPPGQTRGLPYLQINLYGPTRRNTLPSEVQPRARDSLRRSGSLRYADFPWSGFNLCAPGPTSEEIRILMYARWLRRVPSYAACLPTALKSESAIFA